MSQSACVYPSTCDVLPLEADICNLVLTHFVEYNIFLIGVQCSYLHDSIMDVLLILWIYFLVDIWNSLLDFTKRKKNLLEIKTQGFIQSSRWLYLACLTRGGPIVYDTNALKQLNSNTKHGTRYKILPFWGYIKDSHTETK